PQARSFLRPRHPGLLLRPELEAQLVELGLDLVDGLLPEVPDVEELGLALLDEVADRVDPFPLQAVVGPHRQVELLDGAGEGTGEGRGVWSRPDGQPLALG